MRRVLLSSLILLALGVSLLLWARSPTAEILTQLRAPRFLLAFLTGAALACAGAALQSLFRNSLAEPSTLGVSSAAALGAVLFGTLSPQIGASIGALISTFLLAGVARSLRGERVLLSGVMLGLFCSAGVALWMALADPMGVSASLRWLLGDLSQDFQYWSLGILILIPLLAREGFALDQLALGERDARNLGLNVAGLRMRVILLTSLLTSIAVAQAGMIGFVGLWIPYFVRKLGVVRMNAVLWASALLGGTTLCALDPIGQSISYPHEVPVGVWTALAGAPLFFLGFWRQPLAAWRASRD